MNILAKDVPWGANVKPWLAVVIVDVLEWALVAAVLYVAIFYVAMWVL